MNITDTLNFSRFKLDQYFQHYHGSTIEISVLKIKTGRITYRDYVISRSPDALRGSTSDSFIVTSTVDLIFLNNVLCGSTARAIRYDGDDPRCNFNTLSQALKILVKS